LAHLEQARGARKHDPAQNETWAIVVTVDRPHQSVLRACGSLPQVNMTEVQSLVLQTGLILSYIGDIGAANVATALVTA
jgi:hypothetical protein